MAKKIKSRIFKKSFFYTIFIIWFAIIFMFSNQNGTESGKVSEKVTKKILQTKDNFKIIDNNYELNNENGIKEKNKNSISKKRIDKWEIPVRKLAHFILFFCGGIIIFLFLKYGIEYKKNLIVLSVLLGLLIACSDEFHQLYSLNRTPKLFDVGIDTIGVTTGVICANLFIGNKYFFKILKLRIL